MSFNPLTSIGAVQQLASDLAGMGSQLANAAPSGAFNAVFSRVNAEMADLADGGPPPPPAASPPTAAPTLLSAGSGSGRTVSAAAFDPYPTGLSGQSGVTGQAVVADAQQYLGVPYQWGGTDPATGLDCSGLVQRVYSDLGISLPRTSQEQATVGTSVPDLASAQPGDLVFFEPSASGPGHVGIYIGNGEMINAPHTGTVVRVDQVGTPVAIRRILPTTQGFISTAGLAAASLPSTGSAGMDSLGVPAVLQPLFTAAGNRYGVDPLLLASVAKQESGFQTDAVSGAGAQGLMQMMPATAAGLGVSPFDPASAIDGAAQLLSGYLHDYGGSVPMALAAYNAGPAAVATYGGVPPYAETQGYVSNITSMLAGARSGAVL